MEIQRLKHWKGLPLEVDVPELFTSSSSGGIIGVIRIRDTNYNINSVPDLSRLLDRIESGEIVL